MSQPDHDPPPTFDLSTFGRHVRGIREARGLTREELAEASDLCIDTIARLERGTFSPGMYTLRRVAWGLGMSVGDLFVSLDRRDDETAELVAVVRGHDREAIAVVTDMARALLARLGFDGPRG